MEWTRCYRRSDMARDGNGITQFYLSPTHEPYMCLYSQPQGITALWLVLIVPTHEGTARLSLPGWLVIYWDRFFRTGSWTPNMITHPSTNRAQLRLTLLIETNALTTTPNRQPQRCNSTVSHLFYFTCGVWQGGIYCLVLFSVEISDLLLVDSSLGCCAENINVSCLFYADNVVLLSGSLHEMQQIVNLCNKEMQWALPPSSTLPPQKFRSTNSTHQHIGAKNILWPSKYAKMYFRPGLCPRPIGELMTLTQTL